MSDDFLEKAKKTHERWTGEPWSPEIALDSFPLYGKAKRIEALEQIDAAVKASDTSNLREYTRLTRIQRDAEFEHQMLIKNGR
jgi:hypothetical protein